MISNAGFVDWDFEDNAVLLIIWLRVWNGNFRMVRKKTET